MFTADDAKAIAVRNGYQLTSEPKAEKKHYVATADRDGQSCTIDIHKDGHIIEDRPFGLQDAKKLAADNGFTLTSEPHPEKKHFVAAAQKDGKTYEIHLHRDGSIKEHTEFSADDARKIASGAGYKVISEPRSEKKHFQVLGAKNGKFFVFDAHRDGSLKALREVDETGREWKSAKQ